MKLDIGGGRVAVLGDPHLGKRFLNGVPLHRRGEREQMQMADFAGSLNDVADCVAHVCVGDIFDRFKIPLEVLLEAFWAYDAAAKANPNCEYFLIQGNHDASKDFSLASSFSVLAELLGRLPNVTVVRENVVTTEVCEGLTIGLCPWNAFYTAAEIAENLGPCAVAFGHWDIEDFGHENPNKIPLAQLAAVTKRVVTGHEHNARVLDLEGLAVTVTGSMQPYSHAEDPDGRLYATYRLAELPNDDELRNRCVRIQLQPGEKLEREIDCLQLTLQRLKADGTEDQGEVSLGDFDMGRLFAEKMTAFGVPQGLTDEMMARFVKARAAE